MQVLGRISSRSISLGALLVSFLFMAGSSHGATATGWADTYRKAGAAYRTGEHRQAARLLVRSLKRMDARERRGKAGLRVLRSMIKAFRGAGMDDRVGIALRRAEELVTILHGEGSPRGRRMKTYLKELAGLAPEEPEPTPLERLEAKAKEGDAGARNALGALYMRGGEVEADPARARRWFESAAGAGLPAALFNLSTCLRKGQGGPRDEARAALLERQAATAGYAPAQHNLGVRLLRTTATDEQATEGTTWLRKALEQGFAPSLEAMADAFRKGRGVTRSHLAARELYARAAAAGSERAYHNLEIYALKRPALPAGSKLASRGLAVPGR